MKYTKTINLDVNKPFYEVLHAKQNDNARYLLFNILNNGVPFVLTDKTVRAYAIKPDGTKIYNDLTIINAINGQAELQLTSQMLAVVGMISVELVIFEGTDILSTVKFVIEVTGNLRNDAAIESTNEFSALINALAAVDNLEVNYAPRLNVVESSLSDKANQITDLESGLNSIGVTQIDKNKGKFDQTYMTEEFIQQMAGTTPVNAMPAENSITYNQLAFTPIVGNKTKNLFNKHAAINGYYISDTDGALVLSDSSWYASDWIPIIAGQNLYKSLGNRGAFYDINKVFDSGFVNSSQALVAPVNGFIRYSIFESELNTSQLELGSVATSYVNYSLLDLDNLPVLGTSNIADDIITKNKIKNNISNELFTWGNLTFSGYVATLLGNGGKVVFQSKITGNYIWIPSITSYEYTLIDGKALILTWDTNVEQTSALPSVLSEISMSTLTTTGLTKNQHLILAYSGGKIFSSISEFTARINNHYYDSDVIKLSSMPYANDLFTWKDTTVTGVDTILLGVSPIFQSYKTGQFCYFNNSDHDFTYTVPDANHLVVEWDSSVTTIETIDFSRLKFVSINVALATNQKIIVSFIGGVLTSPIPSIQQAIFKYRNSILPTITERVHPLKVKSSLKEKAPLFYAKYKAQTEDLCLMILGDSISTNNYYTTPRTDAKNRPPIMIEHSYVSFIEEMLRWDGQNYFRYDSGIFTEVSPTTPTTLEYDLVNWDWDSNNNRPALTRVLSGLNASVSYQIPSDVKRCDFIYRTDCLNATNAVVTVSGGNGILQVQNESGAWVEANGYSYSAKESATPVPNDLGNLMKSIYQKRLKMKVVGILASTIVTITNNGTGRLTYWGIQTSVREFMFDIISNARGGHNIHRLECFETWDVDYWKPNLILWEIPIINIGLDVANTDYTPKNMGTMTTSVWANEALVKGNQFKEKSYTPELISWIMWFGSGNNAIDDNNKWVYGYCNDGSKVSVPNYVSKALSVLNTNNINVIDMFSLYMEYSFRRSAKENLPIRLCTLAGSGITGTSLTIDGTHFNDLGAKTTMEMFDSFFIQ